METNGELIIAVLNYIEEHLQDHVTLQDVAAYSGYSPYHIHKLFTGMCDMPLHAYVRRRQISRGALLLVNSKQDIAEIAYACGYLSQRSFHKAFVQLYRTSPAAFRKKGIAYELQKPLELKLKPFVNQREMKIEVQQWEELLLEGYSANTKHGFHVIGRCHRQCNRAMRKYSLCDDACVVYGVNDYTDFDTEANQPAFQYFAGFAVSQVHNKKLTHMILPKGSYLVFTFYADPKASMEPYAQDIYHNWLPQSAYRLRQDCCMDIVKYHAENDQGIAEIAYCIPLLKS